MASTSQIPIVSFEPSIAAIWRHTRAFLQFVALARFANWTCSCGRGLPHSGLVTAFTLLWSCSLPQQTGSAEGESFGLPAA